MKLQPPAFQPLPTGHARRSAQVCTWCGEPAPHGEWTDLDYRDHITWDCRQEM